jgi:hypothetical protein
MGWSFLVLGRHDDSHRDGRGRGLVYTSRAVNAKQKTSLSRGIEPASAFPVQLAFGRDISRRQATAKATSPVIWLTFDPEPRSAIRR